MSTEISVIIPVYNTEKYLRQCLDSVMKQTFQDFELLIVDDGSTDSSAAIIKEFSEKYPGRIRSFFQKNQGQSAARNKALQEARGRYVMFVDSDDYIGEKYMETLYETAVREQSDMVICDYIKVSMDGSFLKHCHANFSENGIRIPSHISCNRIISRELLNRYGLRYANGVICEDIPFMLKVEAVADNIRIISLAEYYYRTNPQSTTLTLKKRNLQMTQMPFQALKDCVEFCRKYDSSYSDERMGFFLCRIWTTFIFDVGRGCKKTVRQGMCREVTAFMKEYFPYYYKNPYVRLGAFRDLPKVQKWGTWIFVQALHFRLLPLFAALASLI